MENKLDRIKLAEEALRIPGKIRDLEIEMLEKSDQVLFVKDQVKRIELEVADAVQNEKSESGNAVFSNDVSRKAEVSRRLNRDGKYVEVWEKVGVLEFELRRAKIESDALANRLSSLRMVTILLRNHVEGADKGV